MRDAGNEIYMDHNATSPAVIEIRDTFMNPSSPHSMGQKARDAMEKARANIAACIGAEANEIYFTSGGTEADNWALLSAERCSSGIACVITSSIEHHAILRTCKRLSLARSILPVDGTGRLSIGHLKAHVRDIKRGCALISIMHANNETGMIQPIRAVSELAHKFGHVVHTDAVQSFGKIPVDVDELGVDMMSISAHKIGGPKGVGALYVRKGTPISPMITGGHQERDMRAGTENVAGIVAFGMAAEWAHNDQRLEDRMVSQARMRNRLLDGIKEGLEGVRSNSFPLGSCLPNTLNLGFKGVDSEALLMLLDQEGICVSNGAACESGVSAPSHVLMAMGRSEEEARSAIRFSLGHTNTMDEVEIVIEAVIRLVKALRGGFGDGGKESYVPAAQKAVR